MNMQKCLVKKQLAVLLAGFGLLTAGSAHATLQLAFDANGGPSTVVIDNVSPQDTNPALNTITLANGFQPTPGLIVDGSTHTANFSNNDITSGSSSVTNDTTAAVHIVGDVSATGFAAEGLSDSTASGTFVNAIGSTITVSFWNDPTNTQGATAAGDHPGVEVGTYTFNVTQATQSFSYDSGLVAVNDPGLNSMTVQFDYNLVAGGQLVSRGQAEISSVPEPATPLLMVTGLIALFIKNYRNKNSLTAA
ncbi:MAG: PEP-CTERM sorting domain-containing protein [Methylomonas sp.]|jgi:hypothetical protein